MTINQVKTFTITDYDSFLSYTLTAIGGSVSRSGNTITYTAPGSAGPSGFIINGKTISVAVGANIVMAPSINNIINGANNIDSTISLTGTAFTVSSGSDTHQFTDWQIATDSGFTNIVTQSISDTVNKTSWVSGTLQPATTYYARVRYKGNAYGYSNWSSIITFTTKTTFLPTSEKAILSVNGEYAFGYSVSINTDATRVAIGCPNSSPGGSAFGGAGAVYIFFKSGSSWIQESKLVASDKYAGDRFGMSVYLDSTATRVVIGADHANTTSTDSGKAYIFTRTGTSWAQEAILTASDKAVNDQFGYSVSISDDSSQVLIGANNKTISGVIRGKVYLFTRSGTTWIQNNFIYPISKYTNDQFGCSVDISKDSTRVAVGAYLADVGASTDTGKVVIFG